MLPASRTIPAAICLFAVLPLALTGCDNPRVSIDGHTGVPLAQLDLAGHSAREITLLGADTVHIVPGDTLAIHIDGDARVVAALRFVFNDGKLGIGRQPDADIGVGTATVTITDPAIEQLVLAGSGTILADRLNGAATEVTIGGSGRVIASQIAAQQLNVEVLGSGGFTGSGHADKVFLTIAGTGTADMARLNAGQAEIDLAGTGTGALASDGHVTGTVVGTGTVTVHGQAHCDVSVTGSGRVSCQP